MRAPPRIERMAIDHREFDFCPIRELDCSKRLENSVFV
jgi:hypothetical protein